MVINIAGTSGSGKSHLMRAFFRWAEERGELARVRVSGSARTIGYNIKLKGFQRPIHIVGAYESPTGGCDTIRDVAYVFERVLNKWCEGYQVLYEGLFVMNMTRGPQLVEAVEGDLTVLKLTTPLSVCFSSINSRRAERGEGKLLTKQNTEGNYVRAENYCSKMAGAGARVVRVSRDQALDSLIQLVKQGDG